MAYDKVNLGPLAHSNNKRMIYLILGIIMVLIAAWLLLDSFMELKNRNMDVLTTIRVLAGVLMLMVGAFLIARSKRKYSTSSVYLSNGYCSIIEGLYTCDGGCNNCVFAYRYLEERSSAVRVSASRSASPGTSAVTSFSSTSTADKKEETTAEPKKESVPPAIERNMESTEEPVKKNAPAFVSKAVDKPKEEIPKKEITITAMVDDFSRGPLDIQIITDTFSTNRTIEAQTDFKIWVKDGGRITIKWSSEGEKSYRTVTESYLFILKERHMIETKLWRERKIVYTFDLPEKIDLFFTGSSSGYSLESTLPDGIIGAN
jgi:hypothetical protein